MEHPTTNSSQILDKTCLLLVSHFRNLGARSIHTRLFSHMLHPEAGYVFIGRSQAIGPETPTHPEHVVPCAVLVTECQRMLREGVHAEEQIAALLKRHWKVALITKEEQRRLDCELQYKSKMPPGWRFEDGDTFDRFKRAGIVLVQGEYAQPALPADGPRAARSARR